MLVVVGQLVVVVAQSPHTFTTIRRVVITVDPLETILETDLSHCSISFRNKQLGVRQLVHLVQTSS